METVGERYATLAYNLYHRLFEEMPGGAPPRMVALRQGENEPARAAAARLGAEFVLSGVVRREGSSVTVSVRLFRVDDGAIAWEDAISADAGSP